MADGEFCKGGEITLRKHPANTALTARRQNKSEILNRGERTWQPSTTYTRQSGAARKRRLSARPAPREGARRTRELARLGHVSCGGHLVDITYYDRSIFFSFHHALCDGRGIKPFIETLMYYYFRLKHGVTAAPANVRLAGEPLLPG